ncbi:MAG: transporter substrate-binding domain-containing protein, partial [Desulfamplus sp.]|nr:transporter substrate-binding domain-containing protein [Desulfamplus sp.]
MNKLTSFFQVIVAIVIFSLFATCNADSLNDLFNHEERQWLDKHNGQITLSVESNYAPFAFIDKDGITQGLATEYIELIENRMNFRFKKIRANSLDEIFIKAKEKKVDVINAVTETPGRSEFLTFTKPFIEIPNVIIVRNEHSETLTLETMKDMKVSLVKSYAVTEYIEKNYKNLDLDIVPDDLTALLHVLSNVTDSAVIDLATATYLIKSKGISNLHIAGEIQYSANLALASRRDMPLL